MAMEAMLSLDLSRASDQLVDVINRFAEIGWKPYNERDCVEYLPLGDVDCFDWQESPMTEAELAVLVAEKQAQSELIGLHLFFDDSGIGMTLLATRSGQVRLSLDINRKTLDGPERPTDIAWYHENIVQKLRETCLIEHYEISEWVG